MLQFHHYHNYHRYYYSIQKWNTTVCLCPPCRWPQWRRADAWITASRDINFVSKSISDRTDADGCPASGNIVSCREYSELGSVKHEALTTRDVHSPFLSSNPLRYIVGVSLLLGCAATGVLLQTSSTQRTTFTGFRTSLWSRAYRFSFQFFVNFQLQRSNWLSVSLGKHCFTVSIRLVTIMEARWRGEPSAIFNVTLAQRI